MLRGGKIAKLAQDSDGKIQPEAVEFLSATINRLSDYSQKGILTESLSGAAIKGRIAKLKSELDLVNSGKLSESDKEFAAVALFIKLYFLAAWIPKEDAARSGLEGETFVPGDAGKVNRLSRKLSDFYAGYLDKCLENFGVQQRTGPPIVKASR